MKCEIIHVLGVSEANADGIVRYLQMHTGFEEGLIKRYGFPFQNATERDYVVFNFGHHVGKKLGNDDWPPKYTKILQDCLSMDVGKIPDSHVFFRTTTVRHFLRGKGDWNTNSSQAGAFQPNMHDVWSTYGGSYPEQPIQNLIALDVFLGNNTNGTDRRFRILDTSPMMLARADGSFDGSHFCLPGPMDHWSRMLYYQVEQDDKKSLNGKQE